MLAAKWPEFDQPSTDRLVRDMVGRVPPSVALLLELIGDGVRLTPGGGLPRALVRQVQRQRPHWYPLGPPRAARGGPAAPGGAA